MGKQSYYTVCASERQVFEAVWAYMMEHADIQYSGTYFVKFHTDGQEEFEKRIKARLNGYHRPIEKQELERRAQVKARQAKQVMHNRATIPQKVNWWGRIRAWFSHETP